MAYLIDSSSFIEAKDRTFCFDICPGFWDWLDQQNAHGNVFSIERVYKELDEGNDILVPWIRLRKQRFFLPDDTLSVNQMQQISQWATSGYNQQVSADFLRGADPFLIAFALAHGHTVVSDEILVRAEKKKIKIPVVCEAFNVPCIRPHTMLRTEGVRFILAQP
jgi:hypothetical protein